jgi:hypothetical protein
MDELREFISLWKEWLQLTECKTYMMKSNGSGHQTDSTPHRVRIGDSFWEDTKNQLSPRFGKRMQSQNVESLRGSSCNTRFSPQTSRKTWVAARAEMPIMQYCARNT